MIIILCGILNQDIINISIKNKSDEEGLGEGWLWLNSFCWFLYCLRGRSNYWLTVDSKFNICVKIFKLTIKKIEIKDTTSKL